MPENLLSFLSTVFSCMNLEGTILKGHVLFIIFAHKCQHLLPVILDMDSFMP